MITPDMLAAELRRPGGVAEQAVEEATGRVLADTRQFAPVLSGRLRDSWEAEIGEDASGLPEGTVYSDLHYAEHQEFGTRHQAGTPHVRPALELERRRQSGGAR